MTESLAVVAPWCAILISECWLVFVVDGREALVRVSTFREGIFLFFCSRRNSEMEEP